MVTQLILTVGTNALPVWLAWDHLSRKLRADNNTKVKVRFVYTVDTCPVKDRLITASDRAISDNDHIQTSAGNPQALRRNIRDNVVANLRPDNPTVLHVHYTGGTQMMGVETVAAIESGIEKPHRLQTSYLDVHGGSGPRIRDRRNTSLIADTRQGIDLNLNCIAALNGFEILQSCTPPKEALTAGQEYLQYPNQVYLKTYETFDVGTTGKCVAGGQAYERGKLLEYGAYAAFKKALEAICREAACKGKRRDNYALFHSVEVRRTEVATGAADFELDVVAILGYQIVVVSCCASDNIKEIKLKAMEGYHRARQLGGDEARVVVLSRRPDHATHPNQDTAQDIEDKLKIDIGSEHPPLRVWGSGKWDKLSDHFKNYLDKQMLWS